MSANKIVWTEGMFLQPQHLQYQEKYLERLINNRPSIDGLSNWGLLEYEIDHHLLSLGKFALSSCKGIFPDGTAFDTHLEGYVPPPIDIPQEMNNKIIFLGIPLKQAGMPEVGFTEKHYATSRYFLENVEVANIHSDSNDVTEVQMGRLWLRYILEGQDLGGYSCIPIARVLEVMPDKKVRLDHNFLPSCLDIHAIPKLEDFTKDLLSLFYNRGKTLAEAQSELGTSGATEIMDFMLLMIINRSEALLKFYTYKKGVHPEIFYLYLIELLSSLSIFYDKSRRIKPWPIYRHHDLQSCFEPIILELKQAFSLMVLHSALALPLESKNFGLWRSLLPDKNLLNQADFVLGVRAELPNHELCEQVVKQVKVAPLETIENLVVHSLPGIGLEPLMIPPREIPLNAGFLYFLLDKENAGWHDLFKSSSIAVHFGNQFPGLQVQLWAIRKKAYV